MLTEAEALEIGGKLCGEIEGWCPCDPGVPDAEIDSKKGRKCSKASTYAQAILAAYAKGRENVINAPKVRRTCTVCECGYHTSWMWKDEKMCRDCHDEPSAAEGDE